MIQIVPYTDIHKEAIIRLILNIQQLEFGVPVKLENQPDLENIPGFYGKGNGGFWVALQKEEVAGTIGLLDFGNNQFALRKMFVKKEYRGKEYAIGLHLLQQALQWCREKKATAIYLGTVDQLKAAQRFYEKNGFEELPKEELPASFPLMKVDTLFYKLDLSREI
jgi:GNAT superfamily N-acetyltransferase